MSRPNEPSRPDLYSRITHQIVAQLETGVRPWTRPWVVSQSVSRPLRHDGTPYRGINVVLLWAEAAARGFQSSTWMTFRQALALDAHVRKGEKGSTVVYANALVRTDEDDTREEATRRIPFLKAYTVFNVEQIEGLPASYAPAPAPVVNLGQRIARAEAFFAATGADVRHGGGCAFYAPGPDFVQMPVFESFLDPEAYYATLGHELTHWTRHSSRLDRDLGRRRHGDDGYAREELVAELGAAFLCADLGLALEPREDHAAYLASWLEALRQDNRLIFSAAAHAQRAIDFLHGPAKSADPET
ncbi:zincin-like metallopeptidase domain-containing protein [Brevundimonas sp.]|jgi:antirestriction protein ArdC|uniref:ArdC family protein n=1 Tax=Brevundimonas sp. TaxID=1871086 RepID=UPI002618D44E|nr:zincin-like metallopeptidase domain-containing protein [Brevundimonas sp.]